MAFDEIDTVGGDLSKYTASAFDILQLQIIEVITSQKGVEYVLMRREDGKIRYFAYDVSEFRNYFDKEHIQMPLFKPFDKVLFILFQGFRKWIFWKKIDVMNRQVMKISWTQVIKIIYIEYGKQDTLSGFDYDDYEEVR